jgi:hypothetical protein|tara:strand:- start:404 stop:1138 length:735 start_codon:yes stop_codon:yes gene_type:complete
MIRKDTILGVVINILIVLAVVGTRYYYAKQEMDFLTKDSDRQEELITVNKVEIDTLNQEVEYLRELSNDQHNELQDLQVKYYEQVKWNTEYNQKIKNLKDDLDSLGIELGLAYMNTIPFQFEFGSQDAYMKVFGGMGYKLQNNAIVDSETNVGFDGRLQFGAPLVDQVGKHEYLVYNDDRIWESGGNSVYMSGGDGQRIKVKPPRNQISVGPFVGVQYDKSTGLTEPVIGFGVTYNALKIWDWK